MQVINCPNCGFRHIVPLPSEKELENYYKKEYYKHSQGARTVEGSFSDPLEEQYLLMRYKDRLTLFDLFSHNMKILDIGSGTGHFLDFMKKNGWNTFGLELSQEEVNEAKNKKLNVIQGSVNDLESFFSLNSFPSINLNHVLEHVINPKKILVKCNKLLITGGIIRIEVPNDFSSFQLAANNVARKNWWINFPDHLNYFNLKSLNNLLKSMGFETLYHTSTFPIDMFLLMGDDYTTDPILGKEIFLKIARLELTLTKNGFSDLRKRMFEELCKIGIGRSIIVFAKKFRETKSYFDNCSHK